MRHITLVMAALAICAVAGGYAIARQHRDGVADGAPAATPRRAAVARSVPTGVDQ